MEPTRRTLLVGGAAGITAAALAACGSSDSSSTPATSAAPESASGMPEPASTGESIVAAADVPLEGGVIVDSGQTKVVVTQPQPGEFVGLSAVCPHQNCLVNEIAAERIMCPCHGSEFSITDGSVLQGPATEPLAPVAVKVSGDQIVLG